MSSMNQSIPEVEAENEGNLPSKAEMSAEVALERIRRGETLEHVRIQRLKLKGEFEKPVRLRNCTLVRLEFDGANFQAEVSFISCTLDRPVFNRKNSFQQSLNLTSSTINKAILRELTVQGPFLCNNLVAKRKFSILRCKFHNQVRFWESNIDCWFELKESELAGEADFRSMHLEQGIVFDRSVFQGDFLFRGSSVAKKFQAENTRFEGLFDLSKAKLHDFVYLEQIIAGEKQQFAFLNALGERIQVRPDQIEGRLRSEETEKYEEAMREYGLLKKCYQSLHRFDYEDWAFYRFKVNQRRGCGRSWKRPWTKIGQFCDWLFLDMGCGYGTNPFRAVRAAVVIILFFALLYMFNIDRFYIEKKPFEEEEITSWPNRIMTSLMMSVSVFTSGLSGIRDLAKGWMTIPLIIESLIGTFLWGLFIVAFSRKVIR